MKKYKCNKCKWTGNEDQLVKYSVKGKYGDGYGGYDGCPKCKTEWTGMQIQGGCDESPIEVKQ